VPDVEEQPAADQADADREPAEEVLHALRAAVLPLRQQVGVEAAVRRLVEVVREEEREQDQRHQPEARHERHEREAEADRAERDEHERAPAPIGVWNVSLHGPMTSGSVSAKTPSEPRTTAMSVARSVNCSSSGGSRPTSSSARARARTPEAEHPRKPRDAAGSGTMLAGSVDIASLV
jgi:hypothetical protein